jgi:mannose-1-phosphate guanylyltransferase
MGRTPQGMPDTAMIVAGGRGTRLLPFTSSTPKPMLPFCGAPFLAGVGRRLAAQGVRRILLVVGADPAPFEPLVALLRPFGVEVSMVPEPSPLDTAGGARIASLAVDDAFYVLNGDILTDLDLAALVAHHRSEQAAATIALTRVEDTSAFGVCVREGGRIVDFVEKPPPGTLVGQDCINAGTYLLEPGLLAAFPEGPLSFERTVFPQILAGGAVVAGLVTDGVWSDLGTPERLLAGQQALLAGVMPWPPLDDHGSDGTPEALSRSEPGAGIGVRRSADAEVHPTAVLVAPVVLGAACTVAAGARVGPNTVLAHGVHVGAGAVITGSLVAASVDIGADAVLEEALIGEGARIGAGARVGRLSVVGPDVQVAPRSVLAPESRRPASAPAPAH